MNGHSQPQGIIFFTRSSEKSSLRLMKSSFNIELICGVRGEETPVRIIVCVSTLEDDSASERMSGVFLDFDNEEILI